MGPFHRLRNRRHSTEKTSRTAESFSNSVKQLKNDAAHIIDAPGSTHDYYASSTVTSTSKRRSRSIDRRDEHRSIGRNYWESSRSEKREGHEPRWFERIGGSVISVGRRPKSVDGSKRRSSSRSRGIIQQDHRTRSGRSRSRSNGRSTSGTRTVHSSSRSRHPHDEERGRDHAPYQGSVAGSTRSKSLDPAMKAPSLKRAQSTRVPSSLPNDGEITHVLRKTPVPAVAIGKPPTPPTSSKTHRKQPTPHPAAGQPNTHSTVNRNQGKPQLPTVEAGKSSAFQRWPRIPPFRNKKSDNEKSQFSLDPDQRQHLLTMILGNNGSIFDEGSTLNAPNGEVMRTDPRDRIDVDYTPTKDCGDHVVEAALMFEAISASPFICIQTICCVQDDYLEEERNKLNAGTRGEQRKKQSATLKNGLPEVIKVEGTTITPKAVDLLRDEPSVSVFTTGTLGSREGFWLPFGLGYCGDSVVDVRDERSTPDLSHGVVRREESPDSLVEIEECEIIPPVVDKHIDQPPLLTPIGIGSTSPLRPSKISKSDQSTSQPLLHHDFDEPMEPAYRLEESNGGATPVTSNSSVSNHSTEEANCVYDVSDHEVVSQPSRSLDAVQHCDEPRKKLEEWEEMEAKLKAIFKEKDRGTDASTIISM